MTRSALSRCVACLLAFLAGLTVPGAALVHGYAHEHAAHQRAAHEHEEHAAHGEDGDHHEHGSAAAPLDGARVASAPGQGDDHPHPQVGRAMATRLDLPHFAAIVPPPAVAIDLGLAVRVRFVAAAALPRADPADASQLHSRAPPLD